MSGEPVGPDGLSPRERMVAEIPVDDYIARYEVTDPYTVETLHDFPTLVYLLGRVTEEPQLRDSQFGDSERGVRFLVEGSGMFGHKHPDDAMRGKECLIIVLERLAGFTIPTEEYEIFQNQ